MDIEVIKEIVNRNKKLLEEKYKIKVIGIFGSYANGDFSKRSDVDILVDFFETLDIFEFMSLEDFLSNLLSVKVDLVSKKALKPLIRDDILKETIYI